jgi:hypothetical protein
MINANAIKPNGRSRMMPPATIKHPINAGRAMTKRIVARFLASPHVALTLA